MLKASALFEGPREAPPDDTLTLPFEQRQRSRLVAPLGSGREIALLLPRGGVLRGGARLLADDGSVIEVRAADEELSLVESGEALLLLRAAYHLGNRHVALQIGPGRLGYLHDHVLDDMLRGLGLEPRVVWQPFEPEAGAYGRAGGHGHSHGRGTEPSNEDGHGHSR